VAGYAGESQAHRRARALAEHATDLPLLVDPDGVIRYVGPSVEPLFGYHADDVLHRSGWDFVHPDDEPAARCHFDDVAACPGGTAVWECRVRRADGRWVWTESRATNLVEDDAVGAIVINLRDVSEKHLALHTLQEHEEFYGGILAAAQEGVWVVTDDGRTLYANKAMADILGVDVSEVSAGAMWDFVDGETRTVLRSALRERLQGSHGRYELEFVRRDGERRVLSVSAAPLLHRDGAFRAAVGMCMDITERKRQAHELEQLALQDQLTGLPNRHLLVDRLALATDRHLRTGNALSVLFLNIDRFKLVNDDFGHRAGDTVIQTLARRLRAVARDDDTLARFGGDEFVVVCPDADAYVATRIAETLRVTFDEPVQVGSASVSLGVSVGIACTDTGPADALLQSAESACRRAKGRGRGRIEVHDPSIRRLNEGQLRLVTDLRRAIAADELALDYQPIVRADGQVRAVEALLRWQHPELGPISPAEAVRAAEDNGLMNSLGEWILRRACLDLTRVPNAPDLGVTVNLSARQLVDASIVDVVAATLRHTGLAPGRLTLEVTETSLLVEGHTTLTTLRRLKDLGVRLALDDFGTGYSSLSYLREFPVDVIKIDRSFVAGMTSNRGDLAIVATLTNLAATVGMHVVAEGVETREQEDALRRLGVGYFQGFLWSPAVPTSELPALLRAGQFVAKRTPRGARRAQPQVQVPPVAEDPDRARIIALHGSGASPATIAAALNADGRLTLRGTRWHRNTVAQVIAEAAFPDLDAPTGGDPVAYPRDLSPVADETVRTARVATASAQPW
jgi:diguanylate cyclase (GGDEF)-like protein/PAS domain S-box-containing protein